MPCGRYHHVAVVVWVFVEHDDRNGAFEKEKAFFTDFFRSRAEDASVVFFALYVFHPPGGP
jgi:hypothetical protein